MYERVELRTAGEVLVHAVEVANHIVFYDPMVVFVIGDRLGNESRFQNLPVEFFKRKTVSGLGAVVISADVGNDSRLYLQLYVASVVDLFVLDIGVLEFDAMIPADIM